MIRLFEPHLSCLTTTTYRDLFRIHTRLVKSFAWDASDIVDTQVVRSRPPISAQADARVFSSLRMCRFWQVLKYIYASTRLWPMHTFSSSHTQTLAPFPPRVKSAASANQQTTLPDKMCRFYAHTYQCGHTRTALASYCSQAAFIQHACRSGEICASVSVEEKCSSCHRPMKILVQTRTVDKGTK